MTPQSIDVPLGDRRYRINIAPILNQASLLRQELASYSQVLWLTNTTLEKLYAPWLNDINVGNTTPIVIPDGESYKNFATLETILTHMLNRSLDRKSLLVAFGGGVVGDISGLAAGLYQRGIAVIQVPTTLLAMVDSSVGGKTAVNHPLGKNMIGVIHQPRGVWIDPAFLRTLPDREYRAGLAEVVKYGLLGDVNFLTFLEKNLPAIEAREPETLTQIIAHACRMKADIVVRDENEQGERALLNLGHTFGHAIEALTEYRQFLHGEAVAIGMIMATELSLLLGNINANDVVRVRTLMKGLGLPVDWQYPYPDRLTLHQKMFKAMGHDKKNSGGQLRLILLKSLGKAEVVSGVSPDKIASAMDQATSKGNF